MKGNNIDNIAGFRLEEFCRSCNCPYQQEIERLENVDGGVLEVRDCCKEQCTQTRYDLIQYFRDHKYIRNGPKLDIKECNAETAYEFNSWLEKNCVKIIKKRDGEV